MKLLGDAQLRDVAIERNFSAVELPNRARGDLVKVRAVDEVNAPKHVDNIFQMTGALDIAVICAGAAVLQERSTDVQQQWASQALFLVPDQLVDRNNALLDARRRVDRLQAALREMHVFTLAAAVGGRAESKALRVDVDLEVESFCMRIQGDMDAGGGPSSTGPLSPRGFTPC